jgi:L-lactate permease
MPAIVAPAIVGLGLASVAAFQSATAPAATAAAATAATGLPITSVYQVVADTAHGHPFISQGAGSNTLLLTSLRGQPVATLADASQNMAPCRAIGSG